MFALMVCIVSVFAVATSDACTSSDSFCFVDGIYYTNQRKVAIEPSADGSAIEFNEPLVVRSGEELLLDGTMHTGNVDAIFRSNVYIRGGARLAAYQVNVRFEQDAVFHEDSQLALTAGLAVRYVKCHPELRAGVRFIAQGARSDGLFARALDIVLPHGTRDPEQQCDMETGQQMFHTAYIASYAEIKDRSYERIDGSGGRVCDADPSKQKRSIVAFGQAECPQLPPVSAPPPPPAPEPQPASEIPPPCSTDGALDDTPEMRERCFNLLGTHKAGESDNGASSCTSSAMPWTIAVTLMALSMPLIAFVTYRYVKHGRKPDEAIRELQDILYRNPDDERDAEYAELESTYHAQSDGGDVDESPDVALSSSSSLDAPA